MRVKVRGISTITATTGSTANSTLLTTRVKAQPRRIATPFRTSPLMTVPTPGMMKLGITARSRSHRVGAYSGLAPAKGGVGIAAEMEIAGPTRLNAAAN